MKAEGGGGAGGDDKGFTASESDANEDGYDFYESFNNKDGDKYSYETFDDKNAKPKALYVKEEENGGDDKGYLKKDSKKGSKGYKNFKSFSNKDKDDYNIEKHSGFSSLDSDAKNGDIVAKPVKNYHHYEVTENNSDDDAPKSNSRYSAYPGGYESYTSHDDESGEGDASSGSSSSETASYSNGGEDGNDDDGDDDEGSSEHSSHYEEGDEGNDNSGDHSGGYSGSDEE